MQFGKVAAIDIGASTVGFSVSIVCAALGVGAASLVIGPLTTAALTSVAGLAAAVGFQRPGRVGRVPGASWASAGT